MPERVGVHRRAASPLKEISHAWAEERAWEQSQIVTGSPLHLPRSLAGSLVGGEVLGWRDASVLPSHSRKVLTGKKMPTDLAKIRSVFDASITLDHASATKAMSMSNGSRVIVSQLKGGKAANPPTVSDAEDSGLKVESVESTDEDKKPRKRSRKRHNKSTDDKDLKEMPKTLRKINKSRKRTNKDVTNHSAAKHPAAVEAVDEPGGRRDELLEDDNPVKSTTTSESFHKIRRSVTNGSNGLGLTRSSRRPELGETWHDKVIRLCTMPRFEAFFAALIVANTVVMSFQVQYRGIESGKLIDYYGIDKHANEIWPGADVAFDGLDWAFGVIFSIEIVLKLVAFHVRFFLDPWNVIDFLVVAAWAVEAGAGNLKLPLDPMMLRLIRLVKLLRMLRLIRTVKGFDSLYIMLTAIKGSMWALMWSMLVLLVVIMMLALMTTTLCEAYITDNSNPIERRNLVYKYFGTFSRSGLTMFEMTLANWVPPSRALTENLGEWLVIFALVFKASLGFSVVKVIMGVFVQVTFDVAENDDLIMVNRVERTIKGHSKKMGLLFKAADEDGNGRLDQEEFSKIVGDPVILTWLSAMGFEAANFNAKDVYKLLLEGSDRDDMSAEELVTGFARLKGPATSLNMTVVQRGNMETLETVRKVCQNIDAWTGEVQADNTASPVSANDKGCDEPQDEGQREHRLVVSETLFSLTASEDWSSVMEQSLASRLHWMLHAFVTSFYFEMFFAILIFTNTMVMCAQAQYRGMKNGSELLHPNPAFQRQSDASGSPTALESMCESAQQQAANATVLITATIVNASAGGKDCIPWYDPVDQTWPHAEEVFKYVEYFFGIIFTVETVLKVVALERKFPKDLWNILDAAIIGFWYVETFSSAALPFDPMLMRLFRLLRLLRMARLVKVFEKFDALYLMMTSIKGSLMALAWSSIFLIVFQTMLALIMTTVMEMWLRDDNSKGDKALVFMYWGTFSRSTLTLFEISLANFLPVTRAMMTNVSDLYLIFALVHKFCIGFAVVMVVTGVFVQETVKVAQTDNTIMLNQRERAAKLHSKKMGALFAVADADGSGRLDKEEFEQVCQDPGVVAWLSAMGIDVSDAGLVHTLICDRLGSDDLSAIELVKGMSFVKGAARNIDMAMLRKDTHELQDYVEELEEKIGKLLKARKGKCRHAS
eukprot:TRINITY_DN3312_c0_g1_i2.p1 TRINITY_DN3312_c0_g1~~TRINITY_DN3312_c0_g1_i2.p1  ORF type:complete len:1167 (+),score=199.97 TRINITY_DN3312_c0_g1_i2:114-3614(+)